MWNELIPRSVPQSPILSARSTRQLLRRGRHVPVKDLQVLGHASAWREFGAEGNRSAGRCFTWTRRCTCATAIDACHSQYALIGATSTAPGRSRNLHTAWASGIPLGRRACPAEVSDEEYEGCLADLYASRRAGLG